MTKWITFFNGKSHLVCDDLANFVISDLENRGAGLRSSEEISGKEVAFDMPGMVCVDRPWENFSFMDVRLTIPSEDVASFMLDLERLPLRDFSQGDITIPYYKLHGFCKCIVLTPEQRSELINLLRARVAKAERAAEEFYAVTKAPSEVLREVAAKVNSQPLEEIPDLGGHKVDRFRPKVTRGPIN